MSGWRNVRKRHEGQCAFDFNAVVETVPVVPKPLPQACNAPQPTLDAEGHKYWGKFAGEEVIRCMKLACEAPEHAKEYSEIAGNWKQMKAKHDRLALECL